MKVGLIRRGYRADGGGEIMTAIYAETLQNHVLPNFLKSFSLDLVVSSRGCSRSTFAALKKSSGYNVRMVDHPTGYGRLATERNFGQAVQTLRAEYDLIQTHDSIPGCDIVRLGDGLHHVFLQRIKQEHSYLRRIMHNYSRFHRFKLDRQKETLLSPSVKLVIAPSAMVMREALAAFPQLDNKVHVVCNPVRHAKLLNDIRLRERSDVFYAPKKGLERIRFGFVGSGWARKNLRLCIEAIAKVCDAELHVFGEDKDLAKYQRLAERLLCGDRIFFHGVLHIIQAVKFYDVLLQPAFYEPFGNTVVESYIAGKLVVVSKYCGASEFLGEGCIELQDFETETLVTVMQNLLEDIPATVDVDHQFSQQFFRGRLLEVFRNVL